MLIVLAVLLTAAAVLWYGQADGPTSLTNPAALKQQIFSPDLPVIAEPGDPDVDAGELYEQAISLCVEHENVLTHTPEHDALVDQLCEILLQATLAGHVEDGFLDHHAPIELGGLPDYGPAIEHLHIWILGRITQLHSQNEPERARDLALALWVLGRRMFEHNTGLYPRNTGLILMGSSDALLYARSMVDTMLDTDTLRAWAQAIDDIQFAWQPKLELILGTNPHPGDLVNIALNDEDRMFRVEATLRLGLHRYGVDRGNRRAMQRAIDEAKASDDPLLAEAGRAADAFTRDDRRRFY